MSDDRESVANPVEDIVKVLDSRLRKYLRRHARHLAADHEEIVQDALADLVPFLGARESRLSMAEAQALAYTILQRRLADRHRKALREIVHTVSPDELPDLPSNQDSERSLIVRELLWTVLGALATLDAEERTLLLRDEFSAGARLAPLGTTDRKRLSRLRQRIRSHVRRILGAEIDELLRE